MRIAMLSPIAWRTPPRHYGPWENIASGITEELVKRGYDVTLYATGDSLTAGKLKSVCPRGYEEDPEIIPKVWECLHISSLFEEADQYDIIHNHFDYLPLTYTGLTQTPVVSTIHGFSSPGILPVYRKYNDTVSYVSISNADRSPELDYTATVYHGLNLRQFSFQPQPDDYLLFLGRIHPDKGAREAIEIAKRCGRRLVMAGIIQAPEYFSRYVEPELEPGKIEYIGSVGPEERNDLLGNSVAMLHPILFNEPFGLSVIESMACGTPVVAFEKGSMQELIIDGYNGFLVSNVEEAVRSVKNVDNLRRLDCRSHIEKYFTIEHMVDGYIKVYKKVIEKRKESKLKEVFPNQRKQLQEKQKK
ncbi:MAG: glycosyltransferase family 4 protein [Balneolaceae bacterium]